MTIGKPIKHLSIWLCVTCFYCYQYILRLLPNIIMPELMNKFQIGAKEYGSFAGIYYIGYIVMHLPVGILFSRYGAKKILPFFIALATLGMAPIIYSQSWYYIIVGRLLVGFGSTAAIIAAFQLYRQIFINIFSRALGLTVCIGIITAVYINIPLSIIVHNYGMEQAIKFVLYLGLILIILTYFILPKENQQINNSIKSDLIVIVNNYKVIIVAILAGLMVGPLEGFADAWGSSFITKIFNIERSEANYIVSFILIGMCIGSVILPFIADKTQAYYGVTIFAAVAMITSFIILLSANNLSIYNLKFICLGLGFCSAYQIVILSKMSALLPQYLSGLTAAVGNMIIMCFGYFFHLAIGNIIENSWKGEIIDNLKFYDKQSYILAIGMIPIAIIIALVGLVIISRKEKIQIDTLKNLE